VQRTSQGRTQIEFVRNSGCRCKFWGYKF